MRWLRYWPWLWLGLALMACFAPPLLEGRMLAPWDGIAQGFPTRVLVADSWRHGEVPFWNPYNFSGMPLLAGIQSGALFPGNWPFLVMPPVPAMNVTMLLAFAVAGLGASAFVRSLGATRLGALISGLMFMLSGYGAIHLEHVNMLQVVGLIPWVLWAIERYAQRRAHRYVVLGAALVALQVLAGHPQMLAYGGIVAAAYAAMRTFTMPPKARLGFAGTALGMFALGIGLAAVQLLPTLELIAASQRKTIPYERLICSSADLRSLPTLLMPYLYGVANPSPALPTNVWGGSEWMLGREGYVGVVGMLLAAVGLVGGRRSPQVRFWAVVAGLSLVLAMGGHTPLYRLWGQLPVVQMMPYASRHFMQFTLALAVLAGLGASQVQRGEVSRRALGFGLALIGVPVVFSGVGLLLGGPLFAARAQSALPQIDLRAALSPFTIAYLLPLALCMAASLALVATQRPRAARWGVALAGLLLTVDLVTFAHHQSLFAHCPRMPQALTASAGIEGRHYSISRWAYPYGDDYGYLRDLQVAGPCAIEGRSSVSGYDAFVLSRYGTMMTMQSFGYASEPLRLMGPGHHALDVLHMQRLLLDADLAKQPAWQQALTDARWRPAPAPSGFFQVTNARALPRAWRVARTEVLAPEQVDARMTNDVAFEPARVALLESAPSRLDWAPGTAEAANASLNRIRVSTRGQGPGLVVVSESYDPGWKAFLGQQELPLHRADALVMAVEVPSGEHTVELRYEPTRWKQGLAASAFALLLLLAWAWHARRQTGAQP